MDCQPISTAIVLEGIIAMDNIKDLPHTVCLLFGLTYVLHLVLPKMHGKYTQIYSSCDAWFGKQSPTAKTAVPEK